MFQCRWDPTPRNAVGNAFRSGCQMLIAMINKRIKDKHGPSNTHGQSVTSSPLLSSHLLVSLTSPHLISSQLIFSNSCHDKSVMNPHPPVALSTCKLYFQILVGASTWMRARPLTGSHDRSYGYWIRTNSWQNKVKQEGSSKKAATSDHCHHWL